MNSVGVVPKDTKYTFSLYIDLLILINLFYFKN